MSTPTPPVTPPAPSGPPALEVRGLRRTYGTGPTAVEALRGLDLTAAAGTWTAVMGPSGSGKTTLLGCAGLLERPSAGRVVVGGDDVTDLREGARARLRRERIGFVFQDFHLLPYLTAAQNVELPLRLASRQVDPRRTTDLLARVGLGDRAHHLPGELSGGQQQRVAIARALVTDPTVVLADEPTGSLDSASAAVVLDLLAGATRELGTTVVMVTHDPVAAGYADTVVFLVDGRADGRLDHPTAEAVAGRIAHLDRRTPVVP